MQEPADDRLIVALDVPNVVQGLELVNRIGDAVSFYKVGLGMLTSGGFALPVQWVNRPDASFRGFTGTVARGSVRPGDAGLLMAICTTGTSALG